MKKIIAALFSILFSIGLLAFAGCDFGNKPVNQWDHFDGKVYWTSYVYSEEPPEIFANLIFNSDDEAQMNCWGDTNGALTISLEGMKLGKGNYNSLEFCKIANEKAVTLTKLSLQVYAEEDCEMKFSIRFGKDTNYPSQFKVIQAVGGEATELLFDRFPEQTFEAEATGWVRLRLENAEQVGAIKYGISDVQMTFK